ncbi:MAG: DNA repair protein RecN [Flavobacteriia bacterium]|nr:DNA repair protein RecN [Flavobacteriia bacterium]
MIQHLYIRNYALIAELKLDFSEGFSSITGETGAGKSILLGAMGLALGERADMRSALNEGEKCVVELTVNIQPYALQSLFEELDFDYEDETILRREILPSGKSRAFVNDVPARAADLNKVAQRLIDIHSQNDTLLLRDTTFQLDLIDGLANNSDARLAFGEALAAYKGAARQLKQVEEELTGGEDMDYQQYLLQELVEARLESPDEEEAVEEELNRLQHGEEVAEALGNADRFLIMESGLLDQFDNFLQQISSVAKYDSRLNELVDRMRSAKIEVEDVQGEVEKIARDSEFDPARLRELDQRMGVFQHLKAKHRMQSLGALIELRGEIETKLERFSSLESRLDGAKTALAAAEKSLKVAGDKLTKSRKAVLPKIEAEIGGLLKELNMPDSSIVMSLDKIEEPTAKGFDDVNWGFSANKGRSVQPLHKVASGGELSRVMLALKAIMSKSQSLPTIIFDEIDTGISGETARKVAGILKNMGKSMQVIAITHLPQIAAAGQSHYLVSKQSESGETRTSIRKLADKERVEEISRIISGDVKSDASRANAEELLAQE